jgi:hypothetical protein
VHAPWRSGIWSDRASSSPTCEYRLTLADLNLQFVSVLAYGGLPPQYDADEYAEAVNKAQSV